MKRLLSGTAGLLLVCALIVSPAVAKVLKGTPQSDRLVGTKTADRLFGKPGPDILRSLEGRDLVHGNRGDDFIKGGKGFDEIRSGKGEDKIHARDGKPDQIDCGPGEDTVLLDRVDDGVLDCERIKEPL